jgi:hypothetical protein
MGTVTIDFEPANKALKEMGLDPFPFSKFSFTPNNEADFTSTCLRYEKAVNEWAMRQTLNKDKL